MQAEATSSLFKFIGAPESLLNQNLIIYLLLILIAFIVISDILSSINLFEKKWIQSMISFIIVLIGVSSGKMYQFLAGILEAGFQASYFSPFIMWVVVIGYFVIRGIILILKKRRFSSGQKEKIERLGEKIRALRKIQDIEAVSRGIKE
jgi:hypothetical protein